MTKDDYKRNLCFGTVRGGSRCLIGPVWDSLRGVWWGRLCPCGAFTPPPVKYRRRIVRRRLKRELGERI